MKKGIIYVFSALILTASLMMASAPGVLAQEYTVNASVDPLAIEVNNSTTNYQVFFVGQELTINGYVHSIAEVTAEGMDVGAYLHWTISITGPSGASLPSYVEGSIDSEDYEYVKAEAVDQKVSLPKFTLTEPGTYNVHFHSDAAVYWGDEEEYGSNHAQKVLTFRVADQSGKGKKAHFYASILSEEPMTWLQADSAARNLPPYTPSGGKVTYYPHLASITSQAEQTLIQGISGVDTLLYIGGTDAAREGVWKWVTGERVGRYNNWGEFQPQPDVTHDYMRWNGFSGYVWESCPGNTEYSALGYIVEYEA